MSDKNSMGPGWVTGVLVVCANFLILVGLRVVFTRIPLFGDVHPSVLFWWRDWSMLNIACAVTVAPALAAGFVAAYRKTIRTPFLLGLAASAVVWVGFSPFTFGAGTALTPTGDILVRSGGPSGDTVQWAASSATVFVSCKYHQRRRRSYGQGSGYAPVYSIGLAGDRRVNLNDFKQGNGPSAVDRWIEVLATADDALISHGAKKRIILTEEDCFAKLLEQSLRDEELLRLHPYLPGWK